MMWDELAGGEVIGKGAFRVFQAVDVQAVLRNRGFGKEIERLECAFL